METDVTYSLENAQQFWEELHDICCAPSDNHELIDNALRNYLAFATNFREDYLQTEDDITRCCYALLGANLFKSNRQYVRRQFIYGLLQEDDPPTIHLYAAFLLFDGRSEEETFHMMRDEATFPRLLELIKEGTDDNAGLHRVLLELLCDMSRIQQLTWEDLGKVDDAFVLYLFDLIEQLSDDASDPYHYPIIRILLVLNEQYMCFAQAPSPTGEAGETRPPLTNRIIKLLSSHGPAYRTFGENLILLLNRESALGPQLLILKLLYLLFTTPPTYEYFYTNDLHVLVDVIIRNLLDLDPGSDDESSAEHDGEGGGQRALCHTYLRILHPLLRNTQLGQEGGHYKREELRKLFYLLVNSSSLHFAPVDTTVIRLVARCKNIDWIKDETDSPAEDAEKQLTRSPPSEMDVAKKLLGMNLKEAGESSLSVMEVAAKVEKERPMVPAPRRRKRKTVQTTEQANLNGSLQVPSVLLVNTAADSLEAGGQSPFSDSEYNE